MDEKSSNGQSLLGSSLSSGVCLVLILSSVLLYPFAAESAPSCPASGAISAFAGGGIGDGRMATSAGFMRPIALAQDPSGSIYVADADQNRIRRIDPVGIASTFAGNGMAGYAGDGGQASAAVLSSPAGIATDENGDVFISDSGNHRIRKVSRGLITTIAGTGVGTFSGDGLPARLASLNRPAGIAVSRGYLLIADAGNHRVRRIDPSGAIETVAGLGIAGFRGDHGDARRAMLDTPTAVALADDGTLYIADTGNNRIRAVDQSGIITRVGDEGSSPLLASMLSPTGVDVLSNGDIVVADTGNHRVIAIRTDGTVEALVGDGEPGFADDGADARNARLKDPAVVLVSSDAALLVADTGNQRIRTVIDSRIDTLGGTGPGEYLGDGGPAQSAALGVPWDLEFDRTGTLYIADTTHDRIRAIDPSGVIRTVAGNGSRSFDGDGGPAHEASLNIPYGVALDDSGNLYIADTFNNRIRKVDISGGISTIAGNGESHGLSDNGPATSAVLYAPHDVMVAPDGHIYVADTFHHRVRRISADGTITTIAGTGEPKYGGDGGPADRAPLFYPLGLAMDADENLYISELDNQRIRKVTPDGIITTVAGIGVIGVHGDGGQAVLAGLNGPHGIAVDSSDHLYIADTFSHRIRRVDPGGTITTIAGKALIFGNDGDDGPAREATLNSPLGMAVDDNGDLFIADGTNFRIRKVCV